MTFASGVRIGPYEIQSALGAGGFGEVYRARDTRLGRTVAIKILTARLIRDARARQRFDREARAVASLSHPHICPVYDISETDGIPFLVMEFLEGETLALRLVRGPLTINEVLRYAIDIADALDHAHRQGIVHRDLKPSNIMLTRSGATLLDFGLAKAHGPLSIADHWLDDVPATRTLTREGAILGTLHYMAPEQLHGSDTDARTDVFAFGALLYEMVTRRHAFEGKSQASVIAAILEQHPAPITTRQPLAPPLLDHIVSRCLAKDPDDRWQTISDVKRELQWLAEGGADHRRPAVATSGGRRPHHLAWLAGGIWLAVGTVSTVGLARSSWRIPTDPPVVRFVVGPPEEGRFTQSPAALAVSPDGRFLAFIAVTRGATRIWLRSLDSLAARALPGTEGAVQPFWSPDSRFLAWIAGGKLRKIDIAAGLSQTVADADSFQSGTWSRDNAVLLKSELEGNLLRIPVAGGPAKPITTLEKSRGETVHTWPQFFPDNRHFLYLARSTQPQHDGVVYLGSLDSQAPARLFAPDSHAVYTEPGYLLYMRANTLVAQPFDADSFHVTAEPVAIAQQVDFNASSRRGAFSVSQTGVLAYRPIGGTKRLIWVDRTGKTIESIGPPGHYLNPALSPDEKRVAVARLDPETGAQSIWLIEVARGIASRFTFDQSKDDRPLWSSDGTRIIFESHRGGTSHLYEKPFIGTGGTELLLEKMGVGVTPLDWSRDGRFLLYHQAGFDIPPETAAANPRRGLWLLPLTGTRQPVPLSQTETEAESRLSPGGRWLAYVSGESGEGNVYVRPFPSGEGKWQISVGGGAEPRWRGDGKELFYLTRDHKMMALPIGAATSFEPGVAKVLFEASRFGLSPNLAIRNQWAFFADYVPSADGQRFLINEAVAGTTSSPITVVVNWTALLKK
jgi:Tol biopolymer transport system component